MTQLTTLKIDFVSDIACPWCAVGLAALEQAIDRVKDTVVVDMHFQPFQLNPHMGPDGQDIGEHLAEKYGSTPEQQAQNYAMIRQRGAALGFDFREKGRGRTYNTFDCHRLLHWAEVEQPAKQNALKKALLKANFTDGLHIGMHDVLVQAAVAAGLDGERALEILQSDEFTADVRARQRMYTQAGISSVPAIIINEQHLISGGQPVEVFEQALRQIAAC
jgi:predicted DsbA family dithiol-disulfide isomerase